MLDDRPPILRYVPAEVIHQRRASCYPIPDTQRDIHGKAAVVSDNHRQSVGPVGVSKQCNGRKMLKGTPGRAKNKDDIPEEGPGQVCTLCNRPHSLHGVRSGAPGSLMMSEAQSSQIGCPRTNALCCPVLVRIASAGRIDIRQPQRSAVVR